MNNIIVIVGPTAIGKTALALHIARSMLARSMAVEIINADSMQIYKGLDIGTAKPTREERALVPHHMIDIINPHEAFNVGDFIEMVDPVVNDLLAKGKIPVIVGGTGLYIRAFLYGLCSAPGADWKIRERLLQEENKYGEGYLYRRLSHVDPYLAQKINPKDLVRITRALEVYEKTGKPLSHFQKIHIKRPRYNVIFIGLTQDRRTLYDRINRRVDKMVQSGLVEETRWLFNTFGEDCVPARRLCYKEIGGYIKGLYSLEKAIYLVKRNTRHYAKRQLTWFRHERGIRWFNVKDDLSCYKEIEEYIETFFAAKSLRHINKANAWEIF